MEIRQCVLSASLQTAPASSPEVSRCVARRRASFTPVQIDAYYPASVQGKCYVWKINDERSDLPRFQAVTMFQAHTKYLTRLLLSPDVKYVTHVPPACYNVDGMNCIVRYLATCSADTTVKIWSISPNYESKHEKTLQGHQRWVWDCAFSADSAYLVTGTYGRTGPAAVDPDPRACSSSASSDHTARLWDMSTGETVRQYNGHQKGSDAEAVRSRPLLTLISLTSGGMLCAARWGRLVFAPFSGLVYGTRSEYTRWPAEPVLRRFFDRSRQRPDMAGRT